MFIVFVLLGIIFVSSVTYIFYKLIVWIINKKSRVVGTLNLLLVVGIGFFIYQVFFIKMEFVQSKVCPDLYLVKHPVLNKDSLQKAIKREAMQTKLETLRFYTYSKGDWGENGTAYFLTNKEREDGMLPELLEYYQEYLLATVKIEKCDNSQENIGVIHYYNQGKLVKTDTLFNKCRK